MVRGLILRGMLLDAGYTVYAPPGPPGRSLRPPKRGTLLSNDRVVDYLAARGCRELAGLDARRGLVEVDLAAAVGDVLLVGEVKTRLVPRILSRRDLGVLLDFLRYHLAPPADALEAWERLASRRLVSRGGYDSPASISELTREAVAAHILWGGVGLHVGAWLLCTARQVADAVWDMIASTGRYLSSCLEIEVEPYLVLMYPDRLDKPPLTLRLDCRGSPCRGLPGEARVPATGWVRGCGSCRYRGVCAPRCRGRFSG